MEPFKSRRLCSMFGSHTNENRINSFGWASAVVICNAIWQLVASSSTQSGNLILFLSIIIILIRPRIYRRAMKLTMLGIELESARKRRIISPNENGNHINLYFVAHKSARTTHSRRQPPPLYLSLCCCLPAVYAGIRMKFNCSSLSTCMCALSRLSTPRSYRCNRVANA